MTTKINPAPSPWQRGYAAYFRGDNYTDNPYVSDGGLTLLGGYAGWYEGWDDAYLQDNRTG